MDSNEYHRRMAILHRRLNALCEKWHATTDAVKRVMINRSLAEEMAFADYYLDALKQGR